MHIRIIFPGVDTGLHSQESLDYFNSLGFKVDLVHANVGPATFSNRYEDALAIPGTLQQIKLAEEEGVDAVVIDCMGDPGVEEGRELVRIPVVGPFRTALHVAGTLGDRLGIITAGEAFAPLVRQQARQYYLETRLAAILPINIPPAVMRENFEFMVEGACKKTLEAIELYSADTIILCCTIMMGTKERIRGYLLNYGHDVPVIDPIPLAIHYAKMLVEVKLSHSKQLYGQHDLKIFPGYEFLASIC